MGKEPEKIITVDYINWRGVRALRRIEPLHIWFGSTLWHQEPQWFLRAFDHDKREWRDFALTGLTFPNSNK